jgi:hypothetical protein
MVNSGPGQFLCGLMLGGFKVGHNRARLFLLLLGLRFAFQLHSE